MTEKLTFDQIQQHQKHITEKNIRFPLCTLVENIRSLYNVGSMFRTSDAAAISKFYLTGYTGTPPRKEIDKTALGSTETVAWEKWENPLDCARKLKSQGYTLVAFEHTNRSVDYREVDYSVPTVLMFGNEVEGLSEELCSLADIPVLIPMYGAKQSLNVSVAYGIAVFEAIRNLGLGC